MYVSFGAVFQRLNSATRSCDLWSELLLLADRGRWHISAATIADAPLGPRIRPRSVAHHDRHEPRDRPSHRRVGGESDIDVYVRIAVTHRPIVDRPRLHSRITLLTVPASAPLHVW